MDPMILHMVPVAYRPVLTTVLVAVGAVAYVRGRRASRAAWAELSSRLVAAGFRADAPPGFLAAGIEGAFGARRAAIAHRRNRGRRLPGQRRGRPTASTTVEVAFRGRGFDLDLSRELAVDRLVTRKLGAQDVTVGDEEFDSRYRVRSSDPERAVAALDAEARVALAALGHPRLRADDGRLAVSLPGRVRDPEVVALALRTLDRMAARVEAEPAKIV